MNQEVTTHSLAYILFSRINGISKRSMPNASYHDLINQGESMRRILADAKEWKEVSFQHPQRWRIQNRTGDYLQISQIQLPNNPPLS